MEAELLRTPICCTPFILRFNCIVRRIERGFCAPLMTIGVPLFRWTALEILMLSQAGPSGKASQNCQPPAASSFGVRRYRNIIPTEQGSTVQQYFFVSCQQVPFRSRNPSLALIPALRLLDKRLLNKTVRVRSKLGCS